MIEQLIKELQKYNLSLTAAESITGGRFSNLIVNKRGASKFFRGSFVCYSNDFKYDILKVHNNIGIVTKEMATELAQNSRKILHSDLAISFTGNASDNGIEGKEKGLVYIAVSNKKITAVIEYISKEAKRDKVIDDIAHFGVKFLLEFIENNYSNK